jgi:hypothetical protein
MQSSAAIMEAERRAGAERAGAARDMWRGMAAALLKGRAAASATSAVTSAATAPAPAAAPAGTALAVTAATSAQQLPPAPSLDGTTAQQLAATATAATQPQKKPRFYKTVAAAARAAGVPGATVGAAPPEPALAATTITYDLTSTGHVSELLADKHTSQLTYYLTQPQLRAV